MRRTRGPFGYLIMIASFLLLAWFISDSLKVPTNRITYPELLSKMKAIRWNALSIRGNHLIGLNRNSPIARVDYPARFDFETTIGPDFIDTVRTMFATKNDKPVDQISVNDLGFKVDYLPPIVTPWYVEMLPTS